MYILIYMLVENLLKLDYCLFNYPVMRVMQGIFRKGFFFSLFWNLGSHSCISL